jgi:hypothetical protein
MRLIAPICALWHRASRLWRVWRRRLRRDRAALALFVLLTLGVFEPLICIIHCQIWLPIVLHSYFAAQHQHEHHNHTAGMVATPGAPLVSASLGVGAAPLLGQSWCFMDGGQGDAPGQLPGPPPSPIHEMIPALTLLFGVVLFIIAYLTALPLGPPRVFVPIPLRPPIPIAG